MLARVAEAVEPAETGLYFVANDVVLEWVRAFLTSVRAWNPSIPLCMIPFDDRIDRLRELCPTHRFTIHGDQRLADLDVLGRRLLGGRGSLTENSYRKLACFWGPFERFVILDVDVIVCVNIDRILSGLIASGADVTFAHATPASSLYASPTLIEQAQRAGYDPGINAGAWASRRGLFSYETLGEFADDLLPRCHEVIAAGEQGFLNWCLMKQAVRLESFATTTGLPGWLWAGDPFDLKVLHDGRRPLLSGSDGPVANIVHWAGYDLDPGMPYRELWRRYRWPSDSAGARARRGIDHALSLATRARPRIRRAVL